MLLELCFVKLFHIHALYRHYLEYRFDTAKSVENQTNNCAVKTHAIFLCVKVETDLRILLVKDMWICGRLLIIILSSGIAIQEE